MFVIKISSLEDVNGLVHFWHYYMQFELGVVTEDLRTNGRGDPVMFQNGGKALEQCDHV